MTNARVVTFRPPEDPERLSLISHAVEETFRRFDAHSLERVDVMAQALGWLLIWAPPPDQGAALDEFRRMVEAYADDHRLHRAEPAGRG